MPPHKKIDRCTSYWVLMKSHSNTCSFLNSSVRLNWKHDQLLATQAQLCQMSETFGQQQLLHWSKCAPGSWEYVCRHPTSDSRPSRGRLVVDSGSTHGWIWFLNILWRSRWIDWIDLSGEVRDDNSVSNIVWSCLLVFCVRTHACIWSSCPAKGMHNDACFAASCGQVAEVNSSAPCRRRIAEKTSPICTSGNLRAKKAWWTHRKTWKLDKQNCWWEWINP